MAVVRGVQEQVHFPTYDAISVKAQQQLRDVEPSSTLKFFVNVQGKTKLETNMQSASLLPHYNTFEARAMRVVISDLPPEFPDDTKGKGEDLPVTDEEGKEIDSAGKKTGDAGFDPAKVVTANFELGLARLMELLTEALESDDKATFIDVDEDGVTLFANNAELTS